MQKAALVIRIALGAIAFVAIVVLVGHHDHAGLKGTPVPLELVVICIAAAALAAFACTRLWHSFPAPFVAGIAGALAAGPYGGVLGLFVGLFTASVLGGQHRLQAYSKAKPIA